MKTTYKLTRKDFEQMQSIYERANAKGKYKHMDLQTFAWNYFDAAVKRAEAQREAWTAESLKEFLSSVV